MRITPPPMPKTAAKADVRILKSESMIRSVLIILTYLARGKVKDLTAKKEN